MELTEQQIALNELEAINENQAFTINDREYKLTPISHQFRVEVVSLYSQIEANIIMGNYSFLIREDFKKVMKKVDDSILFDGMQLSKLPKHFEVNAEDYLDYVAISLKVISYPFYKRKMNIS